MANELNEMKDNTPFGEESTAAENIINQIQDKGEAPVVPDELNLLPLRDAVVFPVLVAPIAVGREQFVRLGVEYVEQADAGPEAGEGSA